MCRNFKIMFCLLGLLVAAKPVSAETLKLTTDPFHEDVLPSARISGSLVMGIQQQGRNAEIIDLRAFVPADWAGKTLCLRVVSSNGLYEAANEYSVSPDWQGGVASLPYPTSHSDRLSEVANHEIGARLHLGDCTRSNIEATVVSWNNGGTSERSLLINSFQADAVFVYVEDQDRPIRCEPITLDGRSAYDTRCAMNAVSTARPTEIEILRIVDGNAAPSTSLTIWLDGF